MAARLIRVDCSASCLAVCRCGWRSDPVATRGEADRLADAHRRDRHRDADTARQRMRRHRRAVSCSA